MWGEARLIGQRRNAVRENLSIGHDVSSICCCCEDHRAQRSTSQRAYRNILDRSNGRIELFCFKVLSLAETAYTRIVQRFNEAENGLVLSSQVHGSRYRCLQYFNSGGWRPAGEQVVSNRRLRYSADAILRRLDDPDSKLDRACISP